MNSTDPQKTATDQYVLVVDDEPLILDMICSNLEMVGYKTIRASNGLEAQKLFQQYKTSLALIIIDYAIPLLNGGKLLGEITRSQLSIPTILTSGFDLSELDLPVDVKTVKFISKPFKMEFLMAAIKNSIKTRY